MTSEDHNFEQCIKCTICTVYCPLTAVNPSYPGPKQAGPDGERYRLKKPAFYDHALKACLNCKRCEVACPNDVHIADLIQKANMQLGRKPVRTRDYMLASTDIVGETSAALAPVVNFLTRQRPVRWMLDAVLGIDRHRRLPRYASQRFEPWFRKNAAPSQAQYPRQVTYFHGCYVNYNYPQLGRDLVAVLNALGTGVQLMDDERCCGVAKIANRMANSARRDAMVNVGAITRAVRHTGGEPVIATGSTCVLTMRDEYPRLLGVDTSAIREDIMLATRYILGILERGEARMVWKPGFSLRAAYHAPCHLERLGHTIHTIKLLRLIPGLRLHTLPSQCCGMAGTYGFKRENYRYSQQVGAPLFRSISDDNPQVVITDCETCKWQIEQSTPYPVSHPVSILASAINLEATSLLNNRLDARPSQPSQASQPSQSSQHSAT